jgi:hypothetical protein
LLVAARGRSGVDTTALEHAIALAAQTANDQARFLEASERLLALQPTSEIAENLRFSALERNDRRRDYESLARRRVERRASPGPERREALFLLAWAQERSGDLVAARRTYQLVLGEASVGTEQHARASASAAWAGLFSSPRPRELVEQARAAEKFEQAGPSELTRLACIYLELGLVADAERVIKRLREAGDESSLSASSAEALFLSGALAEAYGVPAAARRTYEQIKPPAVASPVSAFELARRRLQALESKRAPGE